jgi:ATP-binding cassette, subfamily C (CFTR/MRP), member 1
MLGKNKSSKNSLLRACFRAYSNALCAAFVPRLCLTGFTYAQPFMITALTNWIDSKDEPENLGQAMIGAYALVYLGMAVCCHVLN